MIARAAVLYGASEIVIFDVANVSGSDAVDQDGDTVVSDSVVEKPKKVVFDEAGESSESKKDAKKESEGPSPECIRLASLLQYYITPSYLRNLLFTDLKPLQYAKKLPKIPGLPFLSHSSSQFLEGLTVAGKLPRSATGGVKKKKGSRKSKKQLQLEASTEYVQIGEQNVLKLDNQRVPLGTRVTVDTKSKKVVSPKDAYTSSSGVLFTNKDSFGYTVRIAKTFGKIFSESIYPGGYTYTAYVPSEEFVASSATAYEPIRPIVDKKGTIFDGAKSSSHILLVYGRWADVNKAVQNDKEELNELDDATGIFDGRFAIRASGRTEDAILISLAQLE
ncbi:hypothetical protein AWJ20_4690 [Sugiyamaella lignohabitans]|uniref:Uncharacterized protein n=1 Tax=Sugiyamaella lignohabitans TaxID=796027 RepID=A0A167E7T0_9ASCO|nr:uncharacterized protein AWJ20_4690 [Sugiyamaella lignohabitans]ANB13746.1 hypothetical protein AWJ20_4690 [Sugiyamaella lignohabitans]